MASAASCSAQSASVAAALASSGSARLLIFAFMSSLGCSIGLHLGPLALGSIGGLLSLLLGVLHSLIRVVLCLIDALLELVAVLGGCRPRGLHGLVDLSLKIFELCGKSIGAPSGRRCRSECRTLETIKSLLHLCARSDVDRRPLASTSDFSPQAQPCPGRRRSSCITASTTWPHSERGHPSRVMTAPAA
jgi:hypothetical protein